MAITAPPIPRVELANAPTPLLKLERLSQELGVELWVKRDDLTGLLETGNKIRKLEFLIGEALAQSADTLVTCGTLQSNCCRTVAAVCARLGLRAVVARAAFVGTAHPRIQTAGSGRKTTQRSSSSSR